MSVERSADQRGADWIRSAPRLFGDDGRADPFRFKRWSVVWRDGRGEWALVGPVEFGLDFICGIATARARDELSSAIVGPWLIPLNRSQESRGIWRRYHATCDRFRADLGFQRDVNEMLRAADLGAMDWLEVRALSARR